MHMKWDVLLWKRKQRNHIPLVNCLFNVIYIGDLHSATVHFTPSPLKSSWIMLKLVSCVFVCLYSASDQTGSCLNSFCTTCKRMWSDSSIKKRCACLGGRAYMHVCTRHRAPMCVLVCAWIIDCIWAWMHERLCPSVWGAEGKVKWTEPRFVAARTWRLTERAQSTANSFRKQTVKIKTVRHSRREEKSKPAGESPKMWRLKKTHSSVCLRCLLLSQPTQTFRDMAVYNDINLIVCNLFATRVLFLCKLYIMLQKVDVHMLVGVSSSPACIF